MLGAVFRLAFLSILCFGLRYANGQVELTSSNLPIVLIDTDGQEIPEDAKITADMKVIYHGPGVINHVDDNVFNYDGKIGIEKRGSTSISFPKNSYSLETRDTLGNNLNTSLVDMPEENDWVLYAPFTDKSLMRNVLTYELSRRMGWYAPRSRFCEVMINDEYLGVYALMEKIKRDENRVDIANLSPNDTTGDELTGGYILQVDRMDGPGWNSQVVGNVFIKYEDPKEEELVPVQREYIQERFNSMEQFLYFATEEDADSIENTLNIDCFIDYMIINELAKNVDSYRLSTYLYKDKDSRDQRFYMGPVWDYNIAWGNNENYNAWDTSNYIFSDSAFIPFTLFWARKLMGMEFFEEMFEERWEDLQDSLLRIESVHGMIDSIAGVLDEAQERNYEKWDILGQPIWPNYFYGDTYEEEVLILKNWIRGRINWLNGAIMGIGENPSNQTGYRHTVYPQPFKDEFKIRFHEPSPFMMHDIHLSLYSTQGSQVLQLNHIRPASGVITISTGGLSLAPGIYYYQLRIDEKLNLTGKIIKQ